MSGLKYEMEPPRSMSDEELAKVTAGYAVYIGSSASDCRVFVTTFSYCGVYDSSRTTLSYRPCPRCGRPMYTQAWNPKWACDPCNYTEFMPASATWEGSEESLVLAAKQSCL